MTNDTVKLLKECNSGIKMGDSAIKQVMPHAKSHCLKRALNACLDEHATLGDKTHRLLLDAGSDTKDPHPIVRAMSDMKIRGKLMMSPGEHTVADLMTDGCDMGIKSLTRYLNQYTKASDESKDIARSLIAAEEQLECELRSYL